MNQRIILALLLMSALAFRLPAQTHYIVTDTATIDSIKIVNNGPAVNSQVCERLILNQSVYYTPNDILEYGFAKGRTYVSKEIALNGSAKKVFLEKLSMGSTSCYFYQDENAAFYVFENEKIGQVQVPKKLAGSDKNTFREELLALTSDCKDVSAAVKVVEFRRKYMALLTKRYNDCERKPFPWTKFGVLAGVNISKLNYKSGIGGTYFQQENIYFKNADFTYESGLMAGLFADFPINASNWYVHPEVFFTKNTYFSQYDLDEYYVEVEISTASLNLPVLMRYYLPLNTARPFLSAGILYAYQIKDDFYSLTMPEADGAEYPAPVVNNQIGFSAGIGGQFDLNYRFRLYLDARFNYLNGLRISGQESYDKQEWQISGGISF